MQLSSLIEEIKKHNHLYWIENNPEISDEEYDLLINKLKLLDPNNNLLNYVGTTNNEDPIMLSLDKVYSIDELKIWCQKVSRTSDEIFILQPKYDGWAVFYNGNDKLITRGNENIIDKSPLISIMSTSYVGPISNYKKEILGEIILKKQDFINLNSKYKTPRSALAGILSSDTLLYDNYILELIDYNIFSQTFTLNTINEIDWDNIQLNIKDWDYPTDGLVIKLADNEYSKSLGYTNHHPKGQIAFKPKNPSAITSLKNIEWFVGKNNTLTPVAILDPIEIYGHTIQKASLHNYDEIIRLDLHIGDTVLVERCGEIIPQIKKVFPGNNRIPIRINKCPSCDSSVYQDGLFLYCSNSECDGSLAKRLVDSCKRLGLEEIGPGIIDKLIDYGIETIIDIFELEKEHIAQLPNFKEKSIDNLYNEINRIKNSSIDDWKVLSSLNIPNIGRTISKKILRSYTISELKTMSNLDLENIEMIGPKRGHDLYTGLISNEILEYMLKTFNIINSKTNNNIKQIYVCFTGKMPEVRSYYEKIALTKNMTPINTVTNELNLLVAADINDNRGKILKAKKLGIKIISLHEFLNM